MKHSSNHQRRSAQAAIASLFLLLQAHAFVPQHNGQKLRPWGKGVLFSDATTAQAQESVQETLSDETVAAVRAPLKFLGPYPTLALRFPELATSSQRSKNVTGVSLDFILDTAANVNTINGAVAQELRLERQGEAALPGVGAAGAMQGGETYALGDTELEGVLDEKGEPFVFMTDLTASALPIANPATAGLLSLAFLQSFEGGVEFDWGAAQMNDKDDIEEKKPPSVTFYGGSVEKVLEGRTRVSIERVPVTQLPMVTLNINGVSMPALLDTGSPVTVLNAKAAQQAGIETVAAPSANEKSGNPFSNFANRFQQAQAASRGDVLTIMGSDGKPTNLVKSAAPPTIAMPTDTGDDSIEFGETPVYVGDLPGLQALEGLGVNAPPAVVLGMDVLRRRPNMLLRAQQNEVWF